MTEHQTSEQTEQPIEADERAAPEPTYDEDGLPLHRKATLDDVRGGAGSGRTIAVGCAILVALAVLAFWLIRGGLLG